MYNPSGAGSAGEKHVFAMEGNCFEQIHGYELITVQNRFELIDTVKHNGHFLFVYEISKEVLDEIPENSMDDCLKGRLRNNDFIIIRDGKYCAIFGHPTTQEVAVELAKSYSDAMDNQNHE